MEDEERKYSVYIHILPKAVSGYDHDKYYVGITKQKNIKERWAKGNGYKLCTKMRNAINKYGWDSFEHEIIARHLTKSEAEEFEIKLISLLKSNTKEFGYNIESGGNVKDGTCVPFAAYTKDGNFYKLFPSRKAAAEELHTSDTNIGRRPSIKGYMFLKCPDGTYPDKIEPYKSRLKSIYRIDLDGNILEKMLLKDAIEKYGDSVGSCANRYLMTAYGYQWRFIDDIDDIGPVKYQLMHNIYLYDIDGNFIVKCDCLRQAVKWISERSPVSINTVLHYDICNDIHVILLWVTVGQKNTIQNYQNYSQSINRKNL